MAARLIGAMKAKEGIGDLIHLLHDRSWWVRSQAGQALAKFPEGKTILQEIAETTEDLFARDMAEEWIHKGV